VKPATKFGRWFEQALAEHRLYRSAIRAAKEHALNCGFYLICAKEECRRGDWMEQLLAFCGEEIGQRTAQRYMQFATEAMEWAKRELGDVSALKLIAEAKRIAMQSPRSFTELMRSIGEMRAFGEYDAMKYRVKQTKNPQQIEFTFAFEDACKQLSALRVDERVAALAPASLVKLETELEQGLTHVRELIANKKAIES